ncbi:hypothetical protein [Psychroserpens sp.]|uniref:hypothetical protein n=1 Tax=Psychroserpens sp. TaxID=2020870 RepID=UPI002B27A510|nr:hypothetical protein [Psychroserpens sp.]
MKENADKHLDDLSRKVIGKSAVESPSFDFTQRIMTQIKALNTAKATTYVPLISKRIWLLIALGVVAIVGYSIVKAPDSKSSWLKDLSLNQMQFPSIEFPNPFAGQDFSQITVYATLFMLLMLCIQIPLLKQYFNKRLE